MENKSHAFAAGVFVIGVTALLVALCAWLLRDAKLRDAMEFSTREAVTGLQLQAPVRFRGIAVGKVEAISFDPEVRGNVLVRLSIDKDTPITRNTYATLGYQGVTGLAFVQLDAPNANDALLEMDTKPAPRIELKPGLLSNLSDQAGTIFMQVEEATKKINQLLAPENQKTLLGAVSSVGASAGALSQDFKNASNRLQTLLDAQLGPERTDIPALVRDTRATMSALQGTANELSQTAKATSEAANSLAAIGQRANEKGGTLDRVNEGLTQASTAVQALGQSAKSMGQAAQSVGQSAQQISSNTLPSSQRMIQDAARAARAAESAVSQLSESPQSLIFGSSPTPPGPGEAGFSAPSAR